MLSCLSFEFTVRQSPVILLWVPFHLLWSVVGPFLRAAVLCNLDRLCKPCEVLPVGVKHLLVLEQAFGEEIAARAFGGATGLILSLWIGRRLLLLRLNCAISPMDLDHSRIADIKTVCDGLGVFGAPSRSFHAHFQQAVSVTAKEFGQGLFRQHIPLWLKGGENTSMGTPGMPLSRMPRPGVVVSSSDPAMTGAWRPATSLRRMQHREGPIVRLDHLGGDDGHLPLFQCLQLVL